MADDLHREWVEHAEDEADKREEARQQEIREVITKKILEMQEKMRVLGKEIEILRGEDERLNSEGKVIRAALMRWKLKRKVAQLEELERITPSVKF